MKDIFSGFPSYGWIKKLNETRYFSGSVGTDEKAGFFAVNTFQYRIWKKEEKDDDGNVSKFLCVSCYVQPPQTSGKDRFGVEETTFPLTEQCVAEAKEWLAEQVQKWECLGSRTAE